MVCATASYVSVPERETIPGGNVTEGQVCMRSPRRTNATRLVNGAGLDAHLAPLRVDDSGAVRPHETRLGLALERVHDLFRGPDGFSTELARSEHGGGRTLISSCWGMPSVMQTIKPISFSIASMIASAAVGGGT